jgi:hypothetical protein
MQPCGGHHQGGHQSSLVIPEFTAAGSLVAAAEYILANLAPGVAAASDGQRPRTSPRLTCPGSWCCWPTVGCRGLGVAARVFCGVCGEWDMRIAAILSACILCCCTCTVTPWENSSHLPRICWGCGVRGRAVGAHRSLSTIFCCAACQQVLGDAMALICGPERWWQLANTAGGRVYSSGCGYGAPVGGARFLTHVLPSKAASWSLNRNMKSSKKGKTLAPAPWSPWRALG